MKGHICYLGNAASIHIVRWVSYFAEAGWKVDLITWHPPTNNSGIHPAVNIHRIIFPPHYIARYGALLEIIKLIRKIKPDIIHAHYVRTFGILAVLYSCLSGFRPIVLSAWGPYGLIHSKGFHRWLINYALKRADCTTTTSDYLRSCLIKDFRVPESKVMVIPWGINLGVFHRGYKTEVKELERSLGISDDQFVLLSPRSLVSHYRIEQIVRAMPFVLAKYPDVVLIICKGSSKDARYQSNINSLIKKSDTIPNVRLLECELRPEEMAILDNVVDVLISIPISDQFSACIMEGMACGVIPIVGNLEVYKERLVDKENAFFVNPKNPKEIAEKIICCIEHPEIKEKFYKINIKLIEEKEDWNKNAKKMEELYENLLNSGVQK